ncbi:MAG: hypothetical protein ACOYXU_11770 [Nitrospirota bacterium]
MFSAAIDDKLALYFYCRVTFQVPEEFPAGSVHEKLPLIELPETVALNAPQEWVSGKTTAIVAVFPLTVPETEPLA